MKIGDTEYTITETDECHLVQSVGLTKRGIKITATFSKNEEDNKRAVDAVKKFFIE